MLIEFSVSNFRSFREKQTFSMVAAPRLKKRDNVFKPVVKGEKLPDLLKVAAIYGPNASGKSNLIKALDIVPDVAGREPSAEFKPFPVSPFRFDVELANQPSHIELHFVCIGQRYQFELALTEQRIMYERLVIFPKGKETLLYERRHVSAAAGDDYTFGAYLEGGEELHKLWRNVTGPQVLFITQAVANSSETLKQLRDPLNWLKFGLIVVDGNKQEFLKKRSQQNLEESGIFADGLSAFLQDVDVPVTNIRTDKVASGATNPLFPVGHDTKTNTRTVLTHRTALGESDFDFEDESDGTKNLIGFWFIWYLHMRAKDHSTIFPIFIPIIDELDSSLHPEIVVSLIAKHLKADEPSQLIFTTHDTHLMDTKLLRRDQFWITERDTNGATQLRSIHDFEGRESEDLEKRYYKGRYRGLPFVRRG